MITEGQAIERARQALAQIQATFEDREVNVSLRQVYVVVMPPPPDFAAGDFTVIVDAESGAVLAMRIER